MTKSITQQAYNLLVSHWGVDGENDLHSVADHLVAGDRRRAVEELNRQIEYVTATLRAYLSFRSALVMQDGEEIAAMWEKDITDIADWPDRLEA